MSEDTGNLKAWEYSQGNWKKINDPADAFFTEDGFTKDGGDIEEGFRSMGYGRPDYIGDIDAGSFMLGIYSASYQHQRHGTSKLQYPYLVEVAISESTEYVYCPSLPDLLGLINLCSAGLTAALLTGVYKEYEDVIDVIARPARKQIDIEQRAAQARHEQREAQALAKAKARRPK